MKCMLCRFKKLASMWRMEWSSPLIKIRGCRLEESLLPVPPPFLTKAARDSASAIVGTASSKHGPPSRRVKGEDLNGKAY
jgi:hypothetical protein